MLTVLLARHKPREKLIGGEVRDTLSTYSQLRAIPVGGDLGFTSFSFARSEDAAIAGANGEAFDLITADVRLLPGDGVKAVETICAKRHIPVIFITGYAPDIKERLQGRLPDATIVEKPIKEAELMAAVRKVLGDLQFGG